MTDETTKFTISTEPASVRITIDDGGKAVFFEQDQWVDFVNSACERMRAIVTKATELSSSQEAVNVIQSMQTKGLTCIITPDDETNRIECEFIPAGSSWNLGINGTKQFATRMIQAASDLGWPTDDISESVRFFVP